VNHPFSFFFGRRRRRSGYDYSFSLSVSGGARSLLFYTYKLLFYVIWMDIFVSQTSANHPPIDNSCRSHSVPQTTSPPVNWQTLRSKLIYCYCCKFGKLPAYIIYTLYINIIHNIKHYQTRLWTAAKKSFQRTAFIIIIIIYFFQT